MYPVLPTDSYDWMTPLCRLIKKVSVQMWTWWLKTYVRFPLLRPVRYVYFVSYAFGAGSESYYPRSSGNGYMEIHSKFPIRSLTDVNLVRDFIKTASWSEATPPAVAILNWKFLHKQVYRQEAWHDTRRHPRPA